MLFHVSWEIHLEADSPREAAEKARRIQQDIGSQAGVFDVSWRAGSQRLDLDEVTE